MKNKIIIAMLVFLVVGRVGAQSAPRIFLHNASDFYAAFFPGTIQVIVPPGQTVQTGGDQIYNALVGAASPYISILYFTNAADASLFVNSVASTSVSLMSSDNAGVTPTVTSLTVDIYANEPILQMDGSYSLPYGPYWIVTNGVDHEYWFISGFAMMLGFCGWALVKRVVQKSVDYSPEL